MLFLAFILMHARLLGCYFFLSCMLYTYTYETALSTFLLTYPPDCLHALIPSHHHPVSYCAQTSIKGTKGQSRLLMSTEIGSW